MKVFLLLLLLAPAMVARAQGDFHAYSATEDLIEGGQVEKMNIVLSNLLFTIRPPKNWGRVVDAAGRKIVFTSASGKSAVTVQFTAESPGTLPGDDVLRARVLQAHPAAEIMQKSVCPTSYKPGVLYDLIQMPAEGVILKVRHVFLPQPAGEVEVVLSASDDEFEKDKYIVMAMLRAFKVETVKPQPGM